MRIGATEPGTPFAVRKEGATCKMTEATLTGLGLYSGTTGLSETMSEWVSSTLIFVRDIDASISFYVDGLGFTLNMREDHDGNQLYVPYPSASE